MELGIFRWRKETNKETIRRILKLITRKKGWTYSHSFQVHGHYKDGKVIFIESYVKGKDKPFKP